jgi:EpsI family protein
MRTNSSWLIACILLLVAGWYTHQGTQLPSKGTIIEFELFPATLGSWECKPIDPEKVEYYDPMVDRVITGTCRNEADTPIQVYVGLVSAQSATKRLRSPLTNHSSGDSEWVHSRRSLEVPLNRPGGGVLPLSQVLMIQGVGRKVAVTYWYQIERKVLGYDLKFRIFSLVSQFMHQSPRAAVVRLQAEVGDGIADEVFQQEAGLAAALFPRVSESQSVESR